MDYQAVISWLFEQVPNFQLTGASAYKPGLTRIEAFLAHLGNPEKKIKTIHIAGTNGKGSVSHILAAVLTANNYKTGLFTSPHIKDFRERVKIDGEYVSEAFVVDFINKNYSKILELGLSFFEITAALSFYTFAECNCDVAVIETGLGGRLDSTNVIVPEVSVITNIDFDHSQFLGDTLEKIAAEKAGIIKKNVPVVIGDLDASLNHVFQDTAIAQNAPILFSAGESAKAYKTDLLGRYQKRNVHTARCTINVLQQQGWKLEEEKIVSALQHVKKLTKFTGRLEQIGESPKILLDAAHNPNGIKNVLEEVTYFDYDTLYIIYGASNDKDLTKIGTLFPVTAYYFFTVFNSKRSASKEQLAEMAEKNKLNHALFDAPQKAVAACKSIAKPSDLILVCGSFYLMEEII